MDSIIVLVMTIERILLEEKLGALKMQGGNALS